MEILPPVDKRRSTRSVRLKAPWAGPPGYLNLISRLQLSTVWICPGIFFAERLNKSEKSCGLRVILVAKNQACWKGYTLPSKLPSSHQAESVLMQPHLEHTSLVLQQAVYRRRALSPLRSRIIMYEAIKWSRCTSSNDLTNVHKHHTGASTSRCKGAAYRMHVVDASDVQYIRNGLRYRSYEKLKQHLACWW